MSGPTIFCATPGSPPRAFVRLAARRRSRYHGIVATFFDPTMPVSPLHSSRFARSAAVDDGLPARAPDDMGPTLLRLLETGKASDVLDVAEVLHASGRLDPLVVDKDGNHFLGAWVKQAQPRYNHAPEFPGLRAFQLFDHWSNGRVWRQVNRNGQTVLDLWIKAFHDDGSVPLYSEQRDAELAFLLSKAPVETLKNWTVAKTLGPSIAAKTAWQGTTLVAYLTVRGAEKALNVLFDAGFTLRETIHGDPQRPVAMYIRHPGLWQTFLKQGGDPTCPVAHQGTTMALWERLRDEAASYCGDSHQRELQDQLKAQVQTWVEQNASQALNDRELRDYWARFGYAARDRAKHMKTRANWPLLQDEQGRSAMMLLAKAEPNSVRAFVDVQKSRAGATLEDHQGRTLWSYMLQHGESEASSLASQKWLASNVPAKPDHAGHGVVWQALQHEWDGRAATLVTTPGKVLPTRWAPAVWEKTAHLKNFWWGDGACQQALATWITDTMYLGQRHATSSSTSASTNRLPKAMAGIIENTDLHGVHPQLLGALVANELFEFGLDSGKLARIHRLLDAGAVVRIAEDRRSFLTDRHHRSSPGGDTVVAPELQAILSRLEANELRTLHLDEDGLSPARARSRL